MRENGIAVIIDGKTITFEDQGPVVVNNRTLVPMRKIFEVLGATISWDASTNTVTGQKEDTLISLQIGSTTAYINGTATILDVPAQAMNDRTMVPIRFVSEAMGASVVWDGTCANNNDHNKRQRCSGRYKSSA